MHYYQMQTDACGCVCMQLQENAHLGMHMLFGKMNENACKCNQMSPGKNHTHSGQKPHIPLGCTACCSVCTDGLLLGHPTWPGRVHPILVVTAVSPSATPLSGPSRCACPRWPPSAACPSCARCCCGRRLCLSAPVLGFAPEVMPPYWLGGVPLLSPSPPARSPGM